MEVSKWRHENPSDYDLITPACWFINMGSQQATIQQGSTEQSQMLPVQNSPNAGTNGWTEVDNVWYMLKHPIFFVISNPLAIKSTMITPDFKVWRNRALILLPL